jgi:hypothetical protein
MEFSPVSASVDHVALVAEAKDEVLVPMVGVGLHDMPEDGPVADGEHRFWPVFGFFAQARAAPTAQDDDFHEGEEVCWVGFIGEGRSFLGEQTNTRKGNRQRLNLDGQFRFQALMPPLESGNLIVSSVWTDPIPEDSIGMVLAESTVMESNAGRPNAPDLFKTDRGMAGIGLEELEVFVGEVADRLRQFPVMSPEFRRGEMLQSDVQRPAS